MVIQATALSPANNLHWFQSEVITSMIDIVASLADDCSYHIWHQYFGHTSQNALCHASTHLLGVPSLTLPADLASYKGCQIVKIPDHAFPAFGKQASCPLALMYTDLIGPMSMEPHSHARYILTFIDDCTGYALLSFLQAKSDCLSNFCNMVSWAETFTGHTLASVHLDWGGEFMGQEFQMFLTFKGITHQTSVPHTPQQNSHAKRFNWTILEKAEAMHQHACLPKAFWQDTIETALYIYNRQPICHHEWKAPIELFNGKKPDALYFRVFGCHAYVFISPEQQPDKLSPKSEEMTFIGYEPNTKGWHFWSKTKHWVVVATNATFDENFFPHYSRHQEDRPASIPIEDHDPTIGESNELPPLNNDSWPQASEPNWDVYVSIPIPCGNTPDLDNANPALDQEPWFPPMSSQRPQTPLGFDSPACLPSYRTDFSPLYPGIGHDQPETGYRSDIEDWHQHKRYMLTDSPPASTSSEEDWLVKPISQSWFPPKQQSGESLSEFWSCPHQHHPTHDDRSCFQTWHHICSDQDVIVFFQSIRRTFAEGNTNCWLSFTLTISLHKVFCFWNWIWTDHLFKYWLGRRCGNFLLHNWLCYVLSKWNSLLAFQTTEMC